jgi:hypothetical protein
MQYEIANHAGTPDPETIERVLHAIDTAALVDRDPFTGSLRVSSVVAADEMLAMLRHEGFDIAPSHVTRFASQCCGGCGG